MIIVGFVMAGVGGGLVDGSVNAECRELTTGENNGVRLVGITTGATGRADDTAAFN